ncbi:hypothetical protein [Shewanella xiamenensis]|uniref:hypothetical protein n=1 Tax=Shewanella xiamenensis TaxID=332186 RepID=UPI002E7B8EA7|nr:hypothetical protein [Shewanella xiamenensis]MEE1980248.1 hypothetical protein [Shewanella xiamenensis]
MGRGRQNRTREEWATFGHHLLDMLGKKHKLYNEIAGLITKLTAPADDINKVAVTHTLNSHKYELKDHWRKWTQKIKQTPKDKQRTKFYIKNSTYEGILKHIGLTPEDKKTKNISDSNIFDTLLIHLNGYGINNTKEMYDLIEKLEKYKPAKIETNSNKSLFEQENQKHSNYEEKNLTQAIKDIHEELETNKSKSEIQTLINIKWIIYDAIKTKHYQGENNEIINSILEELKRNKITNFEELLNIRKIINEELSEKIETLTDANEKLNEEIFQLGFEIELNESENS